MEALAVSGRRRKMADQNIDYKDLARITILLDQSIKSKVAEYVIRKGTNMSAYIESLIINDLPEIERVNSAQ